MALIVGNIKSIKTIFEDGNVTSPSVSFGSDPENNTGFYLIGDDDIGITTGGVQRMTIDNTSTSIKNVLNIDDTSTSTNSTSGALIVDGGVGVAENLHIGGVSSVAGSFSIGATSADSVAIADFVSTTKGILPPRMTKTQKNLITPVEALTLYNTDTNYLELYSDSNWEQFAKIKDINENIQNTVSNYIGTNWILQTSADDTIWADIIWISELTLFVVCGGNTGAKIMTSPDGINWTSQTDTLALGTNALAWSPELSLIVGVADSTDVNNIQTSPDGVNWTIRTSPTNHALSDVTWSSELSLFVAIANENGDELPGNRVQTSPDGINWTLQTNPTDNFWSSVTWSPELSLLVAVSSSGASNRVMTSPDGITWTSQTAASNNSWRNVIWANGLGLFVAVSSTGTSNRVMTSPDGVTWTSQTSAADNNWKGVTWASELGLLMAISDTGANDRCMVSNDGINWTTQLSANDNSWRNLTWSSDLKMFVAVAGSGTGNRVMTSIANSLRTNNITMSGSTSGFINQKPSATTTSYSITWPSAVGTLNQALTTDASGVLSWTTIATYDSTLIEDADQNTGVEVERTADDNILYFKTAGTDRLTISATGVVNFDSGSVVNINATDTSTTPISGALIVDGGVGIAQNLNVGGNTILTGNLTVNGTTTTLNTSNISVDDSSIKLANGNITDTIDICIYGEYDTGTTAKYAGLYRDASDGNKFKLFTGSQTEPTTTVNTGATGYTAADLVMGSLEGTTGTFSGVVNVNAITTSTSPTSGALIVDGGLGVAENLNIGANISFSGRLTKKVRTSAINTSLDDDYILNTNAVITVTLPDLTNAIYDGVTYIIIKLSADSVILDTATSPDKIFFGGSDVDSITMSGATGERIIITSNGDKWHLI